MIYFVRHIDSGLIKIGCTGDVPARLHNLANQYGVVKLLGVREGDSSDERRLHWQFAEYNVRGVLTGREWFTGAPDLLDYIAQTAVPSGVVYEQGKKRVVNLKSKTRFESLLPAALSRKEIRDDSRYTQRQIALATGISESVISRAFKGKIASMNLETARKLCIWLGCDYSDIIRIVRDPAELPDKEQSA